MRFEAWHGDSATTGLAHDVTSGFHDVELADLYVRFGHALDGEPDDPRLATLADRLAAYISTNDSADSYEDGLDAGFVELRDEYLDARSSPSS